MEGGTWEGLEGRDMWRVVGMVHRKGWEKFQKVAEKEELLLSFLHYYSLEKLSMWSARVSVWAMNWVLMIERTEKSGGDCSQD